jgi:hypothetical protein
MTDPSSDLAQVRQLLVQAAQGRSESQSRARRRGWLVAAITTLALAGGTAAIAAGVFDDGSATIVSVDLKRIATLSPNAAKHLPTVVPGQTIHVFTKATDGFDVDIVPTSGGGYCMVIRDATAVLGTEHAETCGTAAQSRITDRAAMSVTALDGSGAAFGVAPPAATSGVFTIAGKSIPLHVRHGFWAVRLPATTASPTSTTSNTSASRAAQQRARLAATLAVGRARASFK